MKNINANLFTVVPAIILSVFLLACSDGDNHAPVSSEPTLNIVETAVDDGRFTTLVAALQAAELDDDLSGAGPFTVFAPTDDAFDLLPAETVTALLEPDNKATLIDLLLYHVIDAEVPESEAIALNGTRAVMLSALNVRIDVVDDDLILNLNGNREAMVTVTDIECTNGVIHVINAVLDPDDSP
jgi:uncharacterized surface protein with fasciclin (FAS1) repeats